MDTLIWLHSWISEGREDPKPFFFSSFSFFKSSSRPFGLVMLLFRDASVLTPRVRGHSSTGAIPLLLPNALSLWFTTHTGPCHSAPTQPSLTRLWKCRNGARGQACTFFAPYRPSRWDTKTASGIWGFSLTSTMTQSLFDSWFFSSCKQKKKEKSLEILFKGHILIMH